MPAHKTVTVPYEVRPLTPADIAPTGQLANAYRYGTTDQDINPYPILVSGAVAVGVCQLSGGCNIRRG